MHLNQYFGLHIRFKDLSVAATTRLKTCSFISLRSFSNDSSDDSSGDENNIFKKDLEEQKKKKEDARRRMKELIQSFNNMKPSTTEDLQLTPAKPRPRKPKPTKEEREYEVIDFSLKKAAKDVAQSVEGDPAQTESELLNSLRSHSSPKQSLSDLLSEMDVDKESKFSRKPLGDESISGGTPRSRLYEYKRERSSNDFMEYRSQTRIELFSAPPLGIFSAGYGDSAVEKESILNTWDAALKREKILTVTHPPRNYFEEMIKWTEEGKVWTFPIDNEIGLEKEKSYTFADHIFLEKHLEGWCPTKGPIRHFMELVCVGLSKNPYLTVDRKRAHIEWYKNYFASKETVLKEVGAL